MCPLIFRANNMLTRQRVLELLNYDKESGSLFWKNSRGGCIEGSVAGGINSKGYQQIMIDYKQYLVHRIIWLIETGELPTNTIDHRDRDKLNNRFSNLRDVTQLDNNNNRQHPSTKSNNTSGVIGVSYYSDRDRWVQRLTIKGKTRQKYCKTFEEAVQARKKLEEEYL